MLCLLIETRKKHFDIKLKFFMIEYSLNLACNKVIHKKTFYTFYSYYLTILKTLYFKQFYDQSAPYFCFDLKYYKILKELLKWTFLC